jgi:hypothetical protein
MASGTVLGMTHDVNRETVETNPTATFNQQTVAFWLVRNDVYSESDLPSWEKVGSGQFLTASDYTSDLYTRTFAANTTHTLYSVFSQYLFVLGTEYVRPRLQITLSGGGDIEIDQSDSYTDPGHTVTDLESAATLNDVVTITVVDEYDNDQDIATFFQNHGTYILSYSLAAYAAYSDVLVTRRVTVLEPPHTYFGVVVTRDSYAESEQEKIDAGNEQAIADGHGYTDFVLYDFVATYQDDMQEHINNEFPWVANNTPANNILYNQPAIKIAGDGATMIGTGNGSPSAAQNSEPGFMRIEATATNDSTRNNTPIYDAWETDTNPQPHFYCQAIEGRVTGAPLRFYISVSSPNIARRGHVVSALRPEGPWKIVISAHGKQCDWFFDTPRYWYRDGLPRELLEQKGYNGAEYIGAGHQPPHPLGDGYYYKLPQWWR